MLPDAVAITPSPISDSVAIAETDIFYLYLYVGQTLTAFVEPLIETDVMHLDLFGPDADSLGDPPVANDTAGEIVYTAVTEGDHCLVVTVEGGVD